jgi:hypothetical protein
MVRKCAVLLFAVVVASSAAGVEPPAVTYRYIVPVTGNVGSTAGIFYSYTRLINLSTRGAYIAFALFPADRNARCNSTPLSIPPGQFTTLGGRCKGVFAAEIVSTEPLYVRSEVLSYTWAAFRDGPSEEAIPVATAYFRANERTLIPDVAASGDARANLVIVNPGNLTLTATIEGIAPADPALVVTVPPSSIRLVPVTQFVVAGDPITAARHFLVTADGPFQAGASSVRDDGRAQYRAAVSIAPAPPSQ